MQREGSSSGMKGSAHQPQPQPLRCCSAEFMSFSLQKVFFLFQLSHELQHVSRCYTVINCYDAISAPSLLRLCSTRVFKVPDEPCAIQSHQGRLEWLPTRSFLSFSPSFFSHPLDNFLASLHSCNALVT